MENIRSLGLSYISLFSFLCIMHVYVFAYNLEVCIFKCLVNIVYKICVNIVNTNQNFRLKMQILFCGIIYQKKSYHALEH
jgi:hypothetical protein